MIPDTALQNALDAAYAIFARYPRPTSLEAAPTRDGRAILKTLSAAPLRNLTSEQIGPYSGWAMTTVGTVDDYKHFLPRIMEQAVRAPEWMGTEPAILGERLRYANWRSWRPKEQTAVTQIFARAWQQASRSHPDDGDAEDWLCGLGVLGEDLTQPLQEWLSPPSPNAVLQVANLMMMNKEEQAAPTGIWTYVDEAERRKVWTWLSRENVRNALRAAPVAEADAWMIEAALKESALKSVH